LALGGKCCLCSANRRSGPGPATICPWVQESGQEQTKKKKATWSYFWRSSASCHKEVYEGKGPSSPVVKEKTLTPGRMHLLKKDLWSKEMGIAIQLVH